MNPNSGTTKNIEELMERYVSSDSGFYDKNKKC